ncbi:uncharacterized protein LOC130970832 isoform X1 [Arachis stenosperma]|uniref:uncharacterized protein LOC130970832 isoform X1 n=1 Tax=Arachis stenosperma TaxID=217475 RepID=UPI0025AD4D71|nr:uncharacterized protein LOC130970832 isoform X1 [Arachis stenosperma]
MKTKVRLSKSLDREATLAETFKYTHTLKENKVRFVYQQSQNHYKSYTERLEATTQRSQQSRWLCGFSRRPRCGLAQDRLSPIQEPCIWDGVILCQQPPTSTLRPSSGSATSQAIQLEEGVDLRLQVQELQRSLH